MLRKNFCFLSGWKRVFRFATPLEGSAGSKLNQQVVFIHEFTILHRVSWWKFSTGSLEFNGKSFHASSLHLIAFLKHPPWKRDWLWWSGREKNKFPSLLSIKIQIQKVKNWFFLLITPEEDWIVFYYYYLLHDSENRNFFRESCAPGDSQKNKGINKIARNIGHAAHSVNTHPQLERLMVAS